MDIRTVVITMERCRNDIVDIRPMTAEATDAREETDERAENCPTVEQAENRQTGPSTR